MVVDVAPVGIPDRWHAVLSAAVARVGEADARCRIGRREGEHAALRHERLDFARGELRPQAGGSGRVHKASRLSPRSGLRDDDDTRARAQERENPTGTQEHASSPQLRPRGGRRTSAVLAMAPFPGTCWNPWTLASWSATLVRRVATPWHPAASQDPPHVRGPGSARPPKSGPRGP